MRLLTTVALLVVVASTPCLMAQRSMDHPLLTAMVPRGGQRGTEVTLRLYGRRLKEIQDLYLLESGLELLEAKTLRNNQAQVRIKILADCPLGSHRIAVRTRWGISNLKTFSVGLRPEGREKEPNNSASQAQPVQLDTVMNGTVRPEDQDWFKFEAQENQKINFEIEGLRLADLEFDPFMRIVDAKGKVLAQFDDSILGLFDPHGSYTFARAGTYYLHIRETAFGGNNNAHYRLHIGSFPRPTVAFPPGGRPKELLQTTLIGKEGRYAARIQLPDKPTPRHKHYPVSKSGTAPTPIYVHVSDLPAVLEPALAKQRHATASFGPWYFLGPFGYIKNRKGRPAAHDQVYPPEEQQNLENLPVDVDFKGRDGVIRWKKLPRVRDDQVQDLRRLVRKSNDAVAFLYREVNCPSERRALCMFSSDDDLKVWLNGREVHQFQGKRGAVRNRDRVFLNLRKGKNRLLLKVSNRTGRFGYQCWLLDPYRTANVGLLRAPIAQHGIISKPGETDSVRFHAKKGERLEVRVIARTVRSPLDAVVHIGSATDRFYAGNDDSRGADSLVRFTAPHTGEFHLRILDRLGRGGPDYVYRLEIDRRKPRPISTRLQVPGLPYTWSVPVPRGGRMATLVTARDLRTPGAVLQLTGLPAGVTATAAPFQRGLNMVPVVLEAKADAPLGGNLCSVALQGKNNTVLDAGYQQPVVVVRARNNTAFLTTLVDQLPVAVTDRSPFQVDVVAPKVALVRGSPLRLQVKVRRVKGYRQAVRVRMLYNPPGITANQVTIPANKDTGYLYLNARGNARVGRAKVCVVASGNVAGGPFQTSSALVDLAVIAPLMQASIGRVRGTRGQKLKLPIKLEPKGGFDGACRVQLVNLPRGITATTPTVRQDTRQVIVELDLGPRTPPGRHRNFRLRLAIPTKDGVMLHEYRGGEIRVDRSQQGKGN